MSSFLNSFGGFYIIKTRQSFDVAIADLDLSGQFLVTIFNYYR